MVNKFLWIQNSNYGSSVCFNHYVNSFCFPTTGWVNGGKLWPEVLALVLYFFSAAVCQLRHSFMSAAKEETAIGKQQCFTLKLK